MRMRAPTGELYSHSDGLVRLGRGGGRAAPRQVVSWRGFTASVSSTRDPHT